MPSIPVRFPGALGVELAARLDTPVLPPRAYALFAHCFTCSKESKAANFVSATLSEHGIAVLRFDFTGLGASDGDFSNTGFSSNVADLAAAADWLRAHHGAPAILVGHSLGGAAVLAAAHRIPEVLAVATIGAPYEPTHVKALLKSSVNEIEARGEADVELGGRRFRIKREFLNDLDAQSQQQVIAKLRRALLVMHSPLDDTVPIDNATGIFVAAKHPKSFVSLDTADHLLTRREDARYAASVLAWAALRAAR
jgi:putative redox protein